MKSDGFCGETKVCERLNNPGSGMDGMILITRALAIPNSHGVVGEVVAAYSFVLPHSYLGHPL